MSTLARTARPSGTNPTDRSRTSRSKSTKSPTTSTTGRAYSTSHGSGSERTFPRCEEIQPTRQETHVQPDAEAQHAEGSIEQAEDAEYDGPTAGEPPLEHDRHASQHRQRRARNQTR